MKKVIAALLTLVMILAIVPALGESDPIVGAWYADSTDGTTHIVSVYVFDASGSVTLMMLDFEPTGYKKNDSVEPINAGKWFQKRSGVYSIVSWSDTYYTRADLYLDGDRLYLPVSGGKYWSLRRMETFSNDVYTDAQISDMFGQ